MPPSGMPGVYTAINPLAGMVFIKPRVTWQAVSCSAVREEVLSGHFSAPPASEQAGPHGEQHRPPLPELRFPALL